MIIVYKFGGASVKGADEIKNVANILEKIPPHTKCIAVFSAMGKTTNRLEAILKTFPQTDHLHKLTQYHEKIIDELYTDEKEKAAAYMKLQALLQELHTELTSNFTNDKDEFYDRIIPFGERISTCIISQYLNIAGIINTELDARRVIITDNTFRSANVNWQKTENAINIATTELFKTTDIIVTQGFTGMSETQKPVTLGREGSDYSAAIFAHALDAEHVTIWKDVPGVLNADPKYFSDAVKIPFISYWDATELAYYGASVIHPKTIKPLQNKNIPLFVRSFLNHEQDGTRVMNAAQNPSYNTEKKIPSYIFKPNQILISISPRDFSFIEEDNLSYIFKTFSEHHIHINMMQNSALSFSVCIDADKGDFTAVRIALQQQYKVKYNEGITIVTVRHYTEKTLLDILKGKEILLEQKSRYTAQFAVIDPEITTIEHQPLE
ncbi:MAG: aspartate kinase [Bacteroidales bacterium]|jgi:aspartate kinase|nr:aspartate kinase [Bacteroidales bacterium]